MPIQEQNIQFLRSQVMDDVPEGGGAATGTAIPDGVMNNVFEDISDLDRAMGRFNLRKLFLGVRALNTDLYGGAKLVVTQLPQDQAIGYALFTTQDAFDQRAQAQNRVESYLFKGPGWPGYLYANHISGMRALSVIQRVGSELPPIGKTLCLVQDEGLSSEFEQYVRVTQVDVSVQTFEDGRGEFERWIVTLTISDPLRHNFSGFDAVQRQDSDYSFTSKARLRNTTVADATRFFGSQRLAISASIGDREIRAQSQFAPLVPAARSETPLVNQPLNPDLIQTISAGARTVEVPQQAHTLALDVTAENRRLNWVQSILPRPAPNTLSIAYMAQGNWYALTDNGEGSLAGSDPSVGAGTVDYANGNFSVTLGALPDAGSQIMATWASPVHYTVRSGASAINESVARYRHTLSHVPAIADSLTLEWDSDGTTKTATANASGVISGDATGTLDPITGELDIAFAQMPTRGSPLSIGYTSFEASGGGNALTTETIGMTTTVQLSATPMSNTLRVKIPVGQQSYVVLVQDGSNMVLKAGTLLRRRSDDIALSGYAITQDQVIGTLSGSTLSITASTITTYVNRYMGGYSWANVYYQLAIDLTADGEFQYRATGVAGSDVSRADTPDIEALVFRLTPTQADDVVANSIRFTLGGYVYDDASGVLLTDSVGGSPNLVAGGVNYDSGDATITMWADGAAVAPSVTSLLTRYGQWTAIEASFRSPTSPLAPESLGVLATALDGTQISGQANQDGLITGAHITGQVNYEFGTARVEFGAWVLDSSLTDQEKEEDWYDPASIVDGQIWRPKPVDPGTITYNAVAYSFIPLDASIIGVDGVRLPADGRVPIYRSGDVVMIMHADETAPVTPVQGTPVSLGRTRVAWVRVIDDNGDTVTDGYTLDRAAGTVTFDTAPEHTPVTIRHTIADLRLVTDAQIGGQLTLARELSHNFPADESLVGSCLLFGDRRARVSHLWDQVSWNSTWSNSIVGNPATATLNTIDFPVTVTNEGCDTDRWVFRVTNASSNQWELISEKRGLVWSGTYAPGGDDVAPINPRTRVWDEMGQAWVGGTPYMTIPGLANGGGWSNGNVVRINTVGAIADFWIARSIAQSDEPAGDGLDGAEIYALGNIDRP